MMHRVNHRLTALLLAVLLCGCTAPQTEPSTVSENVPKQNPAVVDIAVASPAEDGESAVPPDPDYTALREEALCSVLFISAGKADAALVQAGDRNVLVDAGEDTSVPAILGALTLMGVERLDAVFLSHTHSDHIGGLKTLGAAIPVDRVYRAEISENKDNGENKIDNAAEKIGASVYQLNAGDTVELTEEISFEVLGPRAYNADDDNDNSLVLRLTAAGVRVLFTGDMQFAEETNLMAAGVDLAADILKVGNHGNPDATSERFARAVRPRWAVIPTDRTVDTDSANARVIAALGDADIYITDEFVTGVLAAISADGTVRFADPQQPGTLQVSVAALDRNKQLLTLRNDGAAEADLSRCIVYSTRGSEVFCIPDGTVLAAGESLTISGEEGGGDLRWTGEKNPWNTKKDDSAIFYDSFGNLLARFD